MPLLRFASHCLVWVHRYCVCFQAQIAGRAQNSVWPKLTGKRVCGGGLVLRFADHPSWKEPTNRFTKPNQTKPNQMWHRSRSHYAPTRQNLVRCASSCPMWLGRLVVYCCIGYQIPLWYKYRAASFHTVCGGYRTG